MNDVQAKVLLLIVEDDQLQLLELEESLVEAGYDVLTAANGDVAMDLMKTHAESVKGVITDIRLGAGPNGWSVGHSAREAVAAIPVIYVSGDSSHEWTVHGVPNSIMLAKPFANAQIITAISQLLNMTTPTG